MRLKPRARVAPVIIEATTYYRVFTFTDDAGEVHRQTRQRVIIRDVDGVLRHAYRLADS